MNSRKSSDLRFTISLLPFHWSATPATFDCRADYSKALPKARDQASFARSQFNQLEKRKLRVVMYREQRSLCIYCERRVAEGYPPPRIDHWYPLIPRSRARPPLGQPLSALPVVGDLRLGEARPSLSVRRRRCHVPWPVDLLYEDVVGVTSRGKVYVRADAALPEATRRALDLAIADHPDGARVQRGIINLNHPGLIKARAAALHGERKRMERDLRNRTATREQREERATQLLDQEPRPEFVGIRVAWLRKRLGRGR